MLRLRRFAKNRPHLAGSILLGIGAGFWFPEKWSSIVRCLLGWNIAVWLYLLLMAWLMMHAKHEQVQKIAAQEDESDFAVLFIMVIAVLASLTAIGMQLVAIKGLGFEERINHYLLTGATLFGSWFLMGVIYTVHYARMFYNAPVNNRPLEFPDKLQNPNYWDFLYFSFNIAVAAQTSDVAVLHQVRKTAMAQSILSFFYNVIVVGLSINIVAGVMAG